MASGKASRRKRAAQRAAAPRATRSRPPSRRWLFAGVLASIVVAATLGVVLTRGEGEAAADSAVRGATLPESVEATGMFHGLPQHGLSVGRPDAPVTIVEFADLQCPYCRQFAVETLPTIVQKYVRTGKARLELRGLAFLGPDSERGMRAAFAASRQNRMFELVELLYFNQGAENSGWLDSGIVRAAARSIPGLDVARLLDDMESDAVADLLTQHAAEAARRGVDSTPTLLVGRTGGKLEHVHLASPADVRALERAIASA